VGPDLPSAPTNQPRVVVHVCGPACCQLLRFPKSLDDRWLAGSPSFDCIVMAARCALQNMCVWWCVHNLCICCLLTACSCKQRRAVACAMAADGAPPPRAGDAAHVLQYVRGAQRGLRWSSPWIAVAGWPATMMGRPTVDRAVLVAGRRWAAAGRQLRRRV
jgi:hypothetical protein